MLLAHAESCPAHAGVEAASEPSWTSWLNQVVLDGNDTEVAVVAAERCRQLGPPKSSSLAALVHAGWPHTLQALTPAGHGSRSTMLATELLVQGVENLIGLAFALARAQGKGGVDAALEDAWHQRCAILRVLVNAGARVWEGDILSHRSPIDLIDGAWEHDDMVRAAEQHPFLRKDWSWEDAWGEAVDALLGTTESNAGRISMMLHLGHGLGGALRKRVWAAWGTRHVHQALDDVVPAALGSPPAHLRI